MFDEKYMKSHGKTIDTIEDALMVSGAVARCAGSSCSECAIRMYAKDGDCDIARKKADKFMKENGEEFDFKLQVPADFVLKQGIEAQQALYDELFGHKAPSEEKKAISKGTCAECMNAQMHSSGILWCKSFGNFVHSDGYCYRFEQGGECDV